MLNKSSAPKSKQRENRRSGLQDSMLNAILFGQFCKLRGGPYSFQLGSELHCSLISSLSHQLGGQGE